MPSQLVKYAFGFRSFNDLNLKSKLNVNVSMSLYLWSWGQSRGAHAPSAPYVTTHRPCCMLTLKAQLNAHCTA